MLSDHCMFASEFEMNSLDILFCLVPTVRKLKHNSSLHILAPNIKCTQMSSSLLLISN